MLFGGGLPYGGNAEFAGRPGSGGMPDASDWLKPLNEVGRAACAGKTPQNAKLNELADCFLIKILVT